MIRNPSRLRTAFPGINLRRTYASTVRWRLLRPLEDGSLQTFRDKAFIPSKPALLPKAYFIAIPSIQKWFRTTHHDTGRVALNHSYLSKFGDAIVPLEFTRLCSASAANQDGDSFQRAEVPFYIFLEWTNSATMETSERLYLAQASFASLPEALKLDLPTPEIVAKSGMGDIYDTNIWMGIPPTYTPLHRDPNPNVFVQLAGHKIVRILPPEMGGKIFAKVQNALGRSGSAAFRGEDMMKGKEKRMLEDQVWNDSSMLDEAGGVGYEVHIGRGDGLFIPKGWWHSVRGVGEGITGSVNWWFRPWLPPPWTTTDDRIRGGASQSYLSALPDKCALFHGHLDTSTLGGAGFASQFSPPQVDKDDKDDEDERSWDLSVYDGIEVEVGKGDGKVYTLILKDEAAAGKREDGREKAGINWEVDFKVGEEDGEGEGEGEGGEKGGGDDVTKVWVPWEDFKATFRGKEKKDAGELKKGEVRRVGLMMRSYFGKQEGDFSVVLRSICARKTTAGD